ncbi:YlbG family protein [Fundicoccus culcitae]|uniref:UPF0298 protein NRE15_01045 n=1 Tax=Fundicoccus culcitae TaxID=2969821 RepID=A0ABY5P6D6_9LACT|nr:YlbG family protein [Fundicoccus culcitae]UUX34287.1 YlbG family protein [Fundicoccus culcitae]
MDFEMVERQALIIWVYTLKHVKNLRKYGYIHYTSKKSKYIVMYVDKQQAPSVIKQLNQLHFIRQVDVSHRDEIDMTFKDAIPNRIDPNQRKEVETQSEDFLHNLAQSLEISKKQSHKEETV